jgi:beta-glucosidase
VKRFPDDFIFGASSSAFQIEGGVASGGRGPSIWDTFSARKGTIRNGDRADVACDHYGRWREDIDIAAQLGLDAYRFSISWPRILPEGRGTVNAAGLDFYSALVDGLLEKGIKPFPTLFHWDLPAALQRDMGGFRSRDIVPLFADYAGVVSRALGDRVDTWITINEPFEFSCFGHLFGTHAPGIKNPFAFLQAMHHMLLAHGEAVRVLRAEVRGAVVGPALSWTPVHPATEAEKDLAASERAEAFMNRISFDPILRGAYPEEVARKKLFHPPVKNGDLERISEPVDFIGVNYYSRERARANPLVPLVRADITGKEPRELPESDDRTAMGWEVYHDGLTEILHALRDRYGNPTTYVTEFGSAWNDVLIEEAGERRVEDMRRVRYLAQQLDRIHQAREEGCDLRGCFVWSLMDNFEWAEGFSKRFGLTYIDYQTQRRTVKESGRRYARLIATRDLDAFGGLDD